ncbi:hypothetical protein HZU77_007000 [Neisseriaceae bacterium TC5R-5]|nr:hypothetical protein [Neisseriaceae bacterium TC5R-5]
MTDAIDHTPPQHESLPAGWAWIAENEISGLNGYTLIQHDQTLYRVFAPNGAFLVVGRGSAKAFIDFCERHAKEQQGQGHDSDSSDV